MHFVLSGWVAFVSPRGRAFVRPAAPSSVLAWPLALSLGAALSFSAFLALRQRARALELLAAWLLSCSRSWKLSSAAAAAFREASSLPRIDASLAWRQRAMPALSVPSDDPELSLSERTLSATGVLKAVRRRVATTKIGKRCMLTSTAPASRTQHARCEDRRAVELQLWHDGGITACCGLRRGSLPLLPLLFP